MKIAICISGAVRYPEFAVRSIENITKNYEDLKLFIHTWKIYDREDFTTTIHGLELKEKQNIVETDLGIIDQNQYKYETLLIEDYESKKHHFQKIYDCLDINPFIPDTCIKPRHDIGYISMLYSIWKSNQLKKDYENENNIVFDRVIRMRFDSDFEGKELDLKKLPDCINIPKGEDWCGGVNDQFALGTSQLMDIYSDLYNNLTNMGTIDYHPESILRDYLNSMQIELNRFPFNVIINNKKDFRRYWYGEHYSAETHVY